MDLNNLGGFSDWCEIPHTSYYHGFTSGDSGGLTNSPEIPRTSHDHSFRFGDSLVLVIRIIHFLSVSTNTTFWISRAIQPNHTTGPSAWYSISTSATGNPIFITIFATINAPLSYMATTSTGTCTSYDLVVADYFTRWVEAFAIPNQEATTVAMKLVNEVFCCFSPPEQLHSDQGSQFKSLLLAEVCRLLGIQKT